LNQNNTSIQEPSHIRTHLLKDKLQMVTSQISLIQTHNPTGNSILGQWISVLHRIKTHNMGYKCCTQLHWTKVLIFQPTFVILRKNSLCIKYLLIICSVPCTTVQSVKLTIVFASTPCFGATQTERMTAHA